MNPNARAHRNRRGLSESRAAGHQGQDSSDRKDSTDFHGNVPWLNRIRRARTRRMTTSEALACRGSARQRRNLRIEARKPWSSSVLVLRDDDRRRRAEQISEADADGID
jgi:hypothetical protein